MPSLVSSPEAVTPEWLTQVLQSSGALRSGKIFGFTTRSVGTGQVGVSVRYTLEYSGANDDAPRSVVCKFASTDPTSRSTGVAMRTYEVEVNFYNQIASTVAIRTPRCHFAAIDLPHADSVLVLEDLAPAAQGDQLAGCDVDTAALALTELAKLHAPRWGDSRLAELEWLNRNTQPALEGATGLLPMLWAGFVERYATRLTSSHVQIGEHLMRNIKSFLFDRPGPLTVQHGDYRLDNMLFATSEGGYPLAVVDWQTVTLGAPLADVSYFLGAGLQPEARRTNERPLLEHYLRELQALGIHDLSWDRLWQDYRRYSFGGFLMAVGASMMVVQTARGDEMFMAMAHRHATQIEDLEAVTLL